MHRVVVMMIVAVGVCTGVHGADEEPAPDEYVLAAHLSAGGDLPKYIKLAREFARAHPDSPFAPRATVDWLMAAKVAGDTAQSQEAMRTLIFEYPKSLQSVYIVSQFANASDFTQILDRAFDEQIERPDALFAARYCRAVVLGMRKFGQGVFNADPFTLKCWLLANEADDASLASLSSVALKSPGGDQQRVNAAILDQSTSAVQRIERLQAITEIPIAGLLTRYLLARLSEDELAQPLVQRMRVVSLWRQSKWNDALAVLDEFAPDQRDARWMYYRGSALFASKDTAGAAVMFDELNAKFGSSAWAGSARKLRAALPASAENLRFQSDAVEKSVARFLSAEADFWQVAVRWQPRNRPVFRFDLNYRRREDSIEFVVRKQATPLLAYRCDGRTRTLLFGDEPTAFRYHEPGHLVPKCELNPTADGSRNASWTFGGSDSLRNAIVQYQQLLSEDFLKELGGVQSMLRSMFGWPAVPCPPEKTEAGTRFVWLVPQADSPELVRCELLLDSAGWLRGMHVHDVEVLDLRYGSNDSLPLAPSPFPDRPIKDMANMAPAVLMRSLGAFMEIFFDQPAAEAPRPGVASGAATKSRQ